MLNRKSKYMQALCQQQHPQDLCVPSGEPHAKRHQTGAHAQPPRQAQPVQPATLGKEANDFNDDRHRPQHPNHVFAIAEFIEVQREKSVDRHMRQHVEKQRPKKPQGLGLAQHFAEARLALDVLCLFTHIRQTPHT